jgi:hypothetical protein
MKVILEASKIPIGSTVTRINGINKYMLLDVIKIYGELPREIKADEGTRFLIPREGLSSTISAVPNDKELVWEVDITELSTYLHNELNEWDGGNL